MRGDGRQFETASREADGSAGCPCWLCVFNQRVSCCEAHDMLDEKDETHRRPLLSLIALGCLLSVAPTAQPQATGELDAAVGCVIAAWNAYDADAARRCYDESAVALWSGERHAIDWEFERRLREFDAAARSRFRFEILEARHPNVEFTLYETNQLLDALGLERVTARWRYTVRGL